MIHTRTPMFGCSLIYINFRGLQIEACDALPALHQYNSSELSMVVVRRCSNTSYIPRGTSCLLYLDVGSLSGCASSAQFLLNRLHLCQLIPFIRTELLLLCEEGEEGLETYPHLPDILWECLIEQHYLSNLISLSVPTLAPPHLEEGTQTEEGHTVILPVPRQREGQTVIPPVPRLRKGQTVILPVPRQREVQAITPPSNSYRTPVKPEFNWNMSSSRRHKS